VAFALQGVIKSFGADDNQTPPCTRKNDFMTYKHSPYGQLRSKIAGIGL
jgi:hypothetical protein